MRTIKTKVYQFSELSDIAKEKAIEEMRESYYEYNDFARWVIDDCYLFEPKDSELRVAAQKIGKDYKNIVIRNTREGIYFCADRNRYLDCENIIVEDEDLFLSWLGISKELQEEDSFYWDIRTPIGRHRSTQLLMYCNNEDFFEEIEQAKEKFSDHVEDCLKRISKGIDYYFSEEYIVEEIEANDREFLFDGTLY